MRIPIEDNYEDIVGKSQRGLNLSESQLAKKAGVSQKDVSRALSGQFEESNARKLSKALNLDESALVESGKKAWYPVERKLDGLACLNTEFGDMTVNAYLVWDTQTKQAVAFDTGSTCQGMLNVATVKNLKITLILLTHTHGDHIEDLARLKKETGAPVHVSSLEPTTGAETFTEGKTFQVGNLRIETRLTSGHSRGGMTFVVSGLEHPLAIVGDAIYAGSMGGGMVSYKDALRNNREKILNLPDDTILCPGHGPMTTVAEEKSHNPFFPESRES